MERKVQNVTFNALVYNIRAMLYDTYYTLDHIKIDIISYNDIYNRRNRQSNDEF